MRLIGLAAAMLLLALEAPAAACDKAAMIPGSGSRFVVLAEGDSVTFGQGSSDGKGSYARRSCVLAVNKISASVSAVSRAVLGSRSDPPGANSLFGRMASDNSALAHKAGRIFVLTILIGRNDLVGYGGGAEGYADQLASYVREMRRAGWDRVIVGTVLPSTWEPFDPARDALNAILTRPGWAKAHGVDAIADFAALPSMGRDGQASDTAIYADGIHPTNRGYEIMVPVYDAALVKVLSRAGAGRSR